MTKWPSSSGKVFLDALRRRGWSEQQINETRTEVTFGPMTVALPFTRTHILRASVVSYWGERFGLRPEDVRLK
jgi:hypothetical protein